MKNIAQRVKLKMLRDQMTEIQQNIAKIESNCKHSIKQVGATPKYKHEGFASCENCDRDFGWWCPKSPDHTCHYYTNETKGHIGLTVFVARSVELVNGTEHILHNYDGDPEYENDDDCVFCHAPDERK